jgi:hypothetical protein
MSMRFRLLGFLPVIFFLAHLRYHYMQGTPENMLWMCNISNLTLAAGLFFNVPVLIRVAALWLIPALPLWLLDMLNTTENPPSTFLSHIGGLTVALIAMTRVRADHKGWIFAVLYGSTMQLICRFFTPRALNVNVAFAPYYGYEHVFDAYWEYWLFCATLSVIAMFLLGQLLLRIFPPLKFAPATG